MRQAPRRIAIETGIPLPFVSKKKRGPGNLKGCGGPGFAKYPVDELEIGQSFLVPHALLPASGLDSVRTACLNKAKRLGTKTTARNVDDGVRVWRVS